MKNLLIYINPRKGFDREHAALAKVQVDNTHRMGWSLDDVVMATNFPFEYNGLKAMVLPDSTYCHLSDGRTSKISTIINLFKQGVIDDVCWFHDFDAYQLQPITAGELGLNGTSVGFTDYGWSKKWNTGSFFFYPDSEWVFRKILVAAQEIEVDEEKALMSLTDNGMAVKLLNITYNLGMRKVDRNLELADKPVRVAHFHPNKPGLLEKFRPVIGDELHRLFKEHGF